MFGLVRKPDQLLVFISGVGFSGLLWWRRDVYSLRDNGGVKVLNRGYSEKKHRWKEAEGKAFFVQKSDVGYLKVSFFGPFYGSYVVFELDHKEYQYSLVCGPNKSYLWILARGPKIKPELKDMLVAKAAALGFDTNKLIFLQ